MGNLRLFHRLLLSSLLLVVLAVSLFGLYLFRAEREHLESEVALRLETVARLLELQARPLWALPDDAALAALVEGKRDATDVRVTLVAPDGRVRADSDMDAARMDSHRTRPEIVAAKSDGVGQALRHSMTMDKPMLYVAVVSRVDGDIVGIVRAAMSRTAITAELDALRRRILVAGLVLVALASIASLLVARSISRPVEHMTDVASRFAQGDHSRRARVPGTPELAELAAALNTMADNLDRDLQTIDRLLKEQRSVFQGMHEGLLFVDHEARILDLNAAAARMLDTSMEKARGRQMIEVIRSVALQDLIRRVVESEAEAGADLPTHGDEQRLLHAQASLLRPPGRAKPGALVVLTDVTRIKRLESIRRDFVANASHELKTPVTSIKGFAETLLAMDDLGGDARRFVEIIDRQADQLSSLIEDLLDLTRLEYAQERGDLDVVATPVRAVLDEAVASCAAEAERRAITVVVECPDDLEVMAEPQLLQRAVANLVDNAIKYGGDGKTITVRGAASAGMALLSVRDEGPGIAAEHQARIFERFYRVDKARSRKLGGTGLGLSIVKHVAQTHGGDVSVESRPGHGSTFTITLPLAST